MYIIICKRSISCTYLLKKPQMLMLDIYFKPSHESLDERYKGLFDLMLWKCDIFILNDIRMHVT